MNVALYKVPVEPAKTQSFLLLLGGAEYRLSFQYRDNAHGNSFWLMNITDSNDNRLLSGLPVVPGYNILEQFDYMDIPGALFLFGDKNINAEPDWNTFGDTVNLYYVPRS